MNQPTGGDIAEPGWVPVGDGDARSRVIECLIVIAENKRFIVGVPAACAVLAAIISLMLPNIYTAQTRILAPQQQQSTAATMLGQLGVLAGAAGGALGIKNTNDTYVAMLKSRSIADALVSRFELRDVYHVDALVDARKRLNTATRIAAGKDGVITIEVDDVDRRRAALLARGYIEELYKLSQSLAITEASKRRLFFERQLGVTKHALQLAEADLKRTQEKTGLIRLDDQGRAMIESISRLRTQISSKAVQLNALRASATVSNPAYVLALRELDGLQGELRKLQSSGNHNGDTVFLSTKDAPEAGLQYARSLREYKYQEAMYELVVKQLEIAKLDEAKDPAIVQVLDDAIEPEKKSKPWRMGIVIVAFAVALILAVCISFGRVALAKISQDPARAQQLEVLRRLAAKL